MMITISIRRSFLLHLFVVYFFLKDCNGFIFQHPNPVSYCDPGAFPHQIRIDCEKHNSIQPRLSLPSVRLLPAPALPNRAVISATRVYMGDHSSATLFLIGDTVKVVEDVMKAGKNLKGRTGTVIETWEKCEVDPTCCCAEWVDEGLSVHVKFDVNGEDENVLFGNDTFVHYFAESELQEEKQTQVPFDGMSCKSFKLDRLRMGKQAKRIAAFEESQKETSPH
mmetsp:Transcript_24675/g.52607  ORF Transcript_24675/g.52607 Transcript_24675/m.52607 type:complete len:223 (+) Transcript_24675:85-753(+)